MLWAEKLFLLLVQYGIYRTSQRLGLPKEYGLGED